ncbi:hypothetical protein [Oceanicoccus sagamiensis]|uniref:Uncharacterized protein n=1 Tax=Oceanicoccus sagamiensis TaxID=716816 RepID=A0A1X9NC67_9GAMM|nr:hypothetical protein [Oceanicoccus sagamiensis]ARN73495.1 hypothetical protein BST96_04810 [Oceanicoccus sagamiensis]
MHISPSLLLLLLVIFVFSPSIQEWVTQGGTAWYRPYQLWLITIIFVWWSIRRYERRQNAISEKEKSSNEL